MLEEQFHVADLGVAIDDLLRVIPVHTDQDHVILVPSQRVDAHQLVCDSILKKESKPILRMKPKQSKTKHELIGFPCPNT